jgi:hypothetical protein
VDEAEEGRARKTRRRDIPRRIDKGDRYWSGFTGFLSAAEATSDKANTDAGDPPSGWLNVEI